MKYRLRGFSVTLSLMAVMGCSSETVLLEDKSLPNVSEMSAADVTGTWLDGCADAFNVHVANAESGAPISIPWLTIYNQQNDPVLHNNGYSSSHKKTWDKAATGKSYANDAPSLETVAHYAGLNISDIPNSDLVFVKYSADWCAPCKLQSADLKGFKTEHPELKVAHVEIIADAKNMRGICSR